MDVIAVCLLYVLVPFVSVGLAVWTVIDGWIGKELYGSNWILLGLSCTMNLAILGILGFGPHWYTVAPWFGLFVNLLCGSMFVRKVKRRP